MSSIKLKHSGGNGVIIAAPSSNPASDRTLTVPSNADGTILTTTNPKLGNIIQVVQTVKTSYFTNASVDTVYDVTGVSVDITPTSSSNKIYVTITGAYSNAVDEAYGQLFLARTISGTTVNSMALGDTSGSASRGTFPMVIRSSGAQHGAWAFAIQYLDSPNTTSATTYKLQGRGRYPSNFTIGIGGTYSTSDHNKTRVPTIITAMEVAA